MPNLMTEEIANRLYDILVDDCAATKSMRDSWVHHQTKPDELCTEWRFGGLLGMGGKFWRNAGRWYVDAYSEDYTPKKNKLIAATNKKIDAIREEFKIKPGAD